MSPTQTFLGMSQKNVCTFAVKKKAFWSAEVFARYVYFGKHVYKKLKTFIVRDMFPFYRSYVYQLAAFSFAVLCHLFTLESVGTG